MSHANVIEQPNFETGPAATAFEAEPIGINPKPGHELVQRDESGILFLAPFIWAGSKVNHAFTRGFQKLGIEHPKSLFFGLGFVALAATTLGVAHTRADSLIEGEEDYTQAKEKTTIEFFDFSKSSDIRPLVAKANVTSDLQNTKIMINNRGKDLIPDYPRNFQLKGVANAEYFIPVKDDPAKNIKAALSQQINPRTNKIDILVEMNKTTVNTHWPGAGPEINAYNLNSDGTKDFVNDDTFGEDVNKFLVGTSGLFRINGLEETMQRVDEKVKADMKRRVLEDLRTKCSPIYLPQVKEAIKETIPVMVEALGREGDLGEIVFTMDTDGKWVPQVDPYTKELSVEDATGKDDQSKSKLASSVDCSYKDTAVSSTTGTGK